MVTSRQWPRFSESKLEAMRKQASFTDVQASVVYKEPETPQFQTQLAVGDKKN
jgi:hypothetical protein